MKTIADYHAGRDNNFNLVRVIFALLVVCSHGFTIFTAQTSHPEPTVEFMFKFALAALNGFFIFSGFMVTASIMRRQNLIEYSIARILRIFPALLVVSTMAAFLIGPLATSLSLPKYFSSTETYNYVLITSMTTEPDMPLPGVFKNQAWQGIINLPIWTLRYELFLYVVTAILFIGGLLNRSMAGWIACSIFILYAVKLLILGKESGIEALDHLALFSLSYTVGMASWVYRDRIVLAWQPIPLLILAVWITKDLWFSQILQIACFGYVLFWLAYVPIGHVRSYNKLGDYSYGLYVWHWPVASLLLVFLPQIQPTDLIPLLLVITIPIAILSWHFVEKPALKSTACVVTFLRKIWSKKDALERT